MTQTMAALFLCAAPLLAQTTWTVDVEGGGDFTTLQAAVDAASDGDTILVNYWSGLPVTWNFTLTKGLTIVGVGYQRAETRGHLVIANLPANRRVVLRSLQLSRLSSHPTSVTVQGCVGAVVFDDVVLDGAFGQMFGGPALTVASSHRVHVGRTQLTGAPGLAVDDATVTCTSSWIGGTTVVSGPGTTAPAVDALGSRLSFADCTLSGGSNFVLGGFAGPGKPGLVLAGASATLAGTNCYGGVGFSGFAASVVADTASSLGVDAATWLSPPAAGAVTTAETGRLTGGLGGGWSTFTLDAAPGAFGFLVLALPAPQVPTPFGPYWLAWLAAPIAVGEVPVARTLPPPWFLPHGFPLALQGLVLHGGELRLSTPLVTTTP